MRKLFVVSTVLFFLVSSITVADIIPNNKEFLGNSVTHLTKDRMFGAIEEVVFPSEFCNLNPPPPLPNKTLEINTVYLVHSSGLLFMDAKRGDPWWIVKVINISPDKHSISMKIRGRWNPSQQPVKNWYCNSSVVNIYFQTTEKKKCYISFYNDGILTMGYFIEIDKMPALWDPEVEFDSDVTGVTSVTPVKKGAVTWGEIKKINKS